MTRPMLRSRLTVAAALAGAVAAAACSGTTGPPAAPSPPAAPPGAESIATFAGAAPGRVGTKVTLQGESVIVHAVCRGSGTLFVVPSTEAPQPVRPSGVAIFECAVPATDGRVELLGLPVGEVDFTAYVVEGAGAATPTVFSISIERATD